MVISPLTIVMAQTPEASLPDTEIKVFGIPLGWVTWIIVIILGLLWGYYQRNRKQVVDGLMKMIDNYVSNDFLSKTLQRVTETVVAGVEITYQDLYKELKSASADKKITKEEAEQLRIYAKAKAKEALPRSMLDLLKKNGLDHDSFWRGKIEEAVKRLKREDKIAKAISDVDIKDSIDDEE